MEIRLKPLRRFMREHYRQAIPIMAWAPKLITLFEELKIALTSSPVLARFDPDKPTFLKTDWSAEGMGWILMQPADDSDSQHATKLLMKTGQCLFDLNKDGPRLRPVQFGSRSCTDFERKYHSFVGEAAAGRWAISQNRHYLWGNNFWWMCDCTAVKEILEYEGTISQICRWAQELLGYQFTVVHRSYKMMMDVDALSRRFGPLIAQHCAIAYMLHSVDVGNRPHAYDQQMFTLHGKAKIKLDSATIISRVPIIIKGSTTKYNQVPCTEKQLVLFNTPPVVIASCPVLVTSINCCNLPRNDHLEQPTKMLGIQESLTVNCLCIDDISGSLYEWCRNHESRSIQWNTTALFLQGSDSQLFHSLHPNSKFSILAARDLSAWIIASAPYTNLLEATFIPTEEQSVLQWVQKLLTAYLSITKELNAVNQITLWVASAIYDSIGKGVVEQMISSVITADWQILLKSITVWIMVNV